MPFLRLCYDFGSINKNIIEPNTLVAKDVVKAAAQEV